MTHATSQTISVTPTIHLRFLQRPAVQTVLPFVTSLTFHAAIVLLALSVYGVTKLATSPPAEPPILTGPVDAGEDGIITAQPRVAPIDPSAPERPAHQPDVLDDTSPTSFNLHRGASLEQSLGALGGGETTGGEAVIGIGGNATSFQPRGTGTGRFGGEAKEGSHDVAAWLPGPAEPGNVTMKEIRVKARRVVYLCDATGSMTPIFSNLRKELGDSINRLGNTQAFNVVFFSGDQVLPFHPNSLVLATRDNKAKAVAFMENTQSRGQTDPLPAIRAAFAQDPDLIFVLTDGFDQVADFETVYNEFAVLNKNKKVAVNTILIGTGDQKELVSILDRIAKDNRGVLRVVSKEDF